jgi:hypothetical protein
MSPGGPVRTVRCYRESQNAVTQASTELACSLVMAVTWCVKLGLSPPVAPAVVRDIEYRILYVARGRTRLAAPGGPGPLRPSHRLAPKSHSFSMLLLTRSSKSRPLARSELPSDRWRLAARLPQRGAALRPLDLGSPHHLRTAPTTAQIRGSLPDTPQRRNARTTGARPPSRAWALGRM